ncbi:MAG: hypothetical protein HY913_10635 [Desulfomonile tiedjei]|nr:hypothetical protein [Desulfomonile tiedjei]
MKEAPLARRPEEFFFGLRCYAAGQKDFFTLSHFVCKRLFHDQQEEATISHTNFHCGKRHNEG